mgnify:CR=1 FL=1
MEMNIAVIPGDGIGPEIMAATGFDLETSVERAKDYISGALAAMLDLGKGSGPMDHGFAIDNEYTREAK